MIIVIFINFYYLSLLQDGICDKNNVPSTSSIQRLLRARKHTIDGILCKYLQIIFSTFEKANLRELNLKIHERRETKYKIENANNIVRIRST